MPEARAGDALKKSIPKGEKDVKHNETGNRYSIDEAEDENTRRALARAGADDIDIEGATRAQLRKTVSQGQKELDAMRLLEKMGKMDAELEARRAATKARVDEAARRLKEMTSKNSCA